MSCCPPTSWAQLPDVQGPTSYKPKGIEERISIDSHSSLPIYYTAPSSSSSSSKEEEEMKEEMKKMKSIVVYTDVFGFSNRLKFICDTLADNGYHVIMPDCLRGETLDKNPDLVSWLKQYPGEVIMKDTHACIDYLKSKQGSKDDNGNGNRNGNDNDNNEIEEQELLLSVGAIGFCWGGWAIAKTASDGIRWTCAVSPHPSTKIEGFIFGNDEATMFHKVNMPFLLLPAGDDMDNIKPDKGSEVVKHLESVGGRSYLFDRMRHGWVSRGDLTQDDVREDAEKALALSLSFFNEHM